jgi:hypothetical protein
LRFGRLYRLGLIGIGRGVLYRLFRLLITDVSADPWAGVLVVHCLTPGHRLYTIAVLVLGLLLLLLLLLRWLTGGSGITGWGRMGPIAHRYPLVKYGAGRTGEPVDPKGAAGLLVGYAPVELDAILGVPKEALTLTESI